MLALTIGEPAGIGPDLVVELCQREKETDWVAVGCAQTLRARAVQLQLPLTIGTDLSQPLRDAGSVTVVDVPCIRSVEPGRLDVANAQAVVAMLEHAVAGINKGDFSGLVTAPVQKSIINDAGIVFSGHTEFLCDYAGVEDVVMLLAAGDFRVALATTHLPLRDVARAITRPLLLRRMRILHAGLQRRFGIPKPCIALTGLNPHAGEGGHLGQEEIEVITPVCEELRVQGLDVRGPLPADTLFTPARLSGVDCVMAMYHDQGLPVLKYAGFGEAVNVTLGLPYVRTSVDHGTALDIAGSGAADTGSLVAAIRLAAQLSSGQD